MGKGKPSTSVVTHRVQEEEEDALGYIQQQVIHYRSSISAGYQRLICSRRIIQGAALQTAQGCSSWPTKSCRMRLKGHRQSKPFPCAKGGEQEGAQETWRNTRGTFRRDEMKTWFPSFFLPHLSFWSVLKKLQKDACATREGPSWGTMLAMHGHTLCLRAYSQLYKM